MQSNRTSGLPALLLIFGGAACLLATGCGRASSPEQTEPSLEAQLAAVQAGETDEVHLTVRPVSNADCAKIATATSLRVLLIDQPDSRITAEGLKHLASLPNLEHLRLRGPGVDDAALAEIAKLTGLRFLNVPRASFSDAGIAHLAGHPRLELLRFGSPQVTDAGLQALREMPALTQLHLIGLSLSDAALAELARIDQLQSLYVDDIAFSDAAWEALFAARPRLHVHINQQHHDRDPRHHEH
jgi:hypothetical protein